MLCYCFRQPSTSQASPKRFPIRISREASAVGNARIASSSFGFFVDEAVRKAIVCWERLFCSIVFRLQFF